MTGSKTKFDIAESEIRHPFATDVLGAVEYTGSSRAQLYKDMRAGLLPAHKNGTRTILFYEDLIKYMCALPRATFKPISTDRHFDSDKLASKPAR